MILNLPDHIEDFVNFSVVDAFDIDQLLLGRHDDAGNGAKSRGFKFANVSSIDAILLQLLNFIEIGLLELCIFEIFLLLHCHNFLLLLSRPLAFLLHPQTIIINRFFQMNINGVK